MQNENSRMLMDKNTFNVHENLINWVVDHTENLFQKTRKVLSDNILMMFLKGSHGTVRFLCL